MMGKPSPKMLDKSVKRNTFDLKMNRKTYKIAQGGDVLCLSSQDTSMVIRSRRLKWVTEVKSTGEEKCTERITFTTVTLDPIL